MSRHSNGHKNGHDDAARQGPIGVVAHREKLAPATAAALRKGLAGAGLEVAWRDIAKATEATKATERLVRNGATHIVSCGGDGTVRATIQALAGTDVPLSVVPAGTANLFCHALGLPEEVDDIVDSVRHGADRRLDIGTCNGMAFAVMAGTGIDTTMIDGAEDDKARLGRLAYLVSGAKAARAAERFPVRVKVDGRTLFEGDASCIVVANIGRVMGGIEAVPGAEPDDGRLDVAVATAQGAGQWGGLVWHAIRGDHQATGLVHLGTGSKIRVKMRRRRRFELDGGSKGKAERLAVDVVPDALVVRVPVAS